MTAADYCTLAEVKAVIPSAGYGTAYDNLLTVLITRASRLIDNETNREAGAYATGTAGTARYFTGSGCADIWVDEMSSEPTTVEVDEVGDHTYTTWAASDYMVWPYNRGPYTKLEVDVLNGSKSVWYRFPKSVKITASWGYSVDVPDDIKQATITQVVRYFQRGQQGFEDVGAMTEVGQLRYVKQIDPDVAVIVAGYKRTII